MEPFTTFQDFWPFYVRAHSRRSTRVFHFIGTLALAPVIVLAFVVHPGFALLIPVVGYGFAWTSHFFIEKNRPATFTHPVWALRADLKMFGYICCGRMGRELARCQALPTPAAAGEPG